MLALLLSFCACTPAHAAPKNVSSKAEEPSPPPAYRPASLVLNDGASWSPPPGDWARMRELALSQEARIYGRLVELCDGAGNRLAGSAGQKRAEAIAARWLAADGLSVSLEPVKVPVWVRGPASLSITLPTQESLPLLALGGSVATPSGGLDAPVVVLRDFSELTSAVSGKIVVFNHPMLPGTPSIDRYGEAVAYRGGGASRAASLGAVAVLVRSVTTHSLSTPHTGALNYDESQPKIPAAAITAEDADRLMRLAAIGPVKVHLELAAHTEPDADAVNVVGELRGTTHPEEIVVIGGHLDSWDVGQGASDDGAGSVESVEAVRLLASLGRPARTVRVVLFANEENGLRGGKAYFAAHGAERHVAAIESDLGGGGPRGWGLTASAAQRAWLDPLLRGSAMTVRDEGGGADISLIVNDGALGIGLLPDDSHYFDVHHTAADTVDKIDPRAFAESTAALATLLSHLANAPDAPPKAEPRGGEK